MPHPPSRFRATLAARNRGDRGSISLELVVVFTGVLLLMFGVVQGAMYYHARHLALAAAQEGLRDARVENGTAAAGAQRARQFLTSAGGTGLLSGVAVTPLRTATRASVTVRGRSVSVLPGFAGLPVSETAAGPVELWTSAGR